MTNRPQWPTTALPGAVSCVTLAHMGMTCRCCREYIGFASFEAVDRGTCDDCAGGHDRSHPDGWRDAERDG